MSDMESNDELIKHVRDPLFSGSALCFTLADRLQTLQAELNFCMGTVKNYDGKINKLKAENEALKAKSVGQTYQEMDKEALKRIETLTTEAARLREALVVIDRKHIVPIGKNAITLLEISNICDEALKPKEKNT